MKGTEVHKSLHCVINLLIFKMAQDLDICNTLFNTVSCPKMPGPEALCSKKEKKSKNPDVFSGKGMLSSVSHNLVSLARRNALMCSFCCDC